MPGGSRQDNRLELEGLREAMEALVNHAKGLSRTMLADAAVLQTEGAVRGLAATILASAAELVAGGNPERPAFKTYSDGLITLLGNETSAFVRGGVGEFVDRG